MPAGLRDKTWYIEDGRGWLAAVAAAKVESDISISSYQWFVNFLV